jgi:hypothetical protein
MANGHNRTATPGFWSVSSPDDRITVDWREHDGRIQYRLRRDGRTLLQWAGVDVAIDGEHALQSPSVVDVARADTDDTWQPVWGERSFMTGIAS